MTRLLALGATSPLASAICERYSARGAHLYVAATDAAALDPLLARCPGLTWERANDGPGFVRRAVHALGGLDGALLFCDDVAVITDTPIDILERHLLLPVLQVTEVATHLEARRRGHLAVLNVIRRVHRDSVLEPALQAATRGFDAFIHSQRRRLAGAGVTLTLVTLGVEVMPALAADDVVRAIDQLEGHAFVPRRARVVEWVLDCLPSWVPREIAARVSNSGHDPNHVRAR